MLMELEAVVFHDKNISRLITLIALLIKSQNRLQIIISTYRHR